MTLVMKSWSMEASQAASLMQLRYDLVGSVWVHNEIPNLSRTEAISDDISRCQELCEGPMSPPHPLAGSPCKQTGF